MKGFFILLIGMITMIACTSSIKTSNKEEQNISKNEEEAVNSSFYQKKFLDGIGFFARGNEPNWTLDVDFERSIKFEMMYGVKLDLNTIKKIETLNADTTRYQGTDQDYTLIVTLIKENCQDNMSGEPFDYKVKVDLKKVNETTHSLFEGCGRYLYDYRLNNIWVLREITGAEANIDKIIKSNLTFEFDLKQMKFRAHTSCNYLMGKIELMGTRLSFDVVINTTKICPDMEAENDIVNAINKKTFTYKIEEHKLTLENNSGVKMVFKRVD